MGNNVTCELVDKCFVEDICTQKPILDGLRKPILPNLCTKSALPNEKGNKKKGVIKWGIRTHI